MGAEGKDLLEQTKQASDQLSAYERRNDRYADEIEDVKTPEDYVKMFTKIQWLASMTSNNHEVDLRLQLGRELDVVLDDIKSEDDIDALDCTEEEKEILREFLRYDEERAGLEDEVQTVQDDLLSQDLPPGFFEHVDLKNKEWDLVANQIDSARRSGDNKAYQAVVGKYNETLRDIHEYRAVVEFKMDKINRLLHINREPKTAEERQLLGAYEKIGMRFGIMNRAIGVEG